MHNYTKTMTESTKDKSENTQTSTVVIEGITESGEAFRPSDWAERMSGQLSTFRRNRIIYSPKLRPAMKDGNKCVVLDPKLEKSNPKLYRSIMTFVKNNKLRICSEEDESREDAKS